LSRQKHEKTVVFDIFLFALSGNADSIPIPKLNGYVSYDQIEYKWFLIIMSICILTEVLFSAIEKILNRHF